MAQGLRAACVFHKQLVFLPRAISSWLRWAFATRPQALLWVRLTLMQQLLTRHLPPPRDHHRAPSSVTTSVWGHWVVVGGQQAPSGWRQLTAQGSGVSGLPGQEGSRVQSPIPALMGGWGVRDRVTRGIIPLGPQTKRAGAGGWGDGPLPAPVLAHPHPPGTPHSTEPTLSRCKPIPQPFGDPQPAPTQVPPTYHGAPRQCTRGTRLSPASPLLTSTPTPRRAEVGGV